MLSDNSGILPPIYRSISTCAATVLVKRHAVRRLAAKHQKWNIISLCRIVVQNSFSVAL